MLHGSKNKDSDVSCYQIERSSLSHQHGMTSSLFDRECDANCPKEKEKKRLSQLGNPCLRESRKKFTSGASTRQTSTIKLGRGSLVGVGRVLPYVLSLMFFNLLVVFMIYVAY